MTITRRIKAATVAVVIAATMLAAPSANAAGSYSWMCYKAGSPTHHVYSASTVGWLVGYYGYTCVGGRWV